MLENLELPVVSKIEGLSGDTLLIQNARNRAQEGKNREAALLYEQANRLSQAAKQYETSGDLPNALRCYKDHFQGKVVRIEELLRNEEVEKAVTAWKQARESYIIMRGLEPEVNPNPTDFDALADIYTRMAEQMRPHMEQYETL